MYLEEIEIKNVGPIEEISLKLPFNKDGYPLPVVLVGNNGAGKSIILSLLAKALSSAKKTILDEKEDLSADDNVHRLSMIKSGASHSVFSLRFSDGLLIKEINVKKHGVLKEEEIINDIGVENWSNGSFDKGKTLIKVNNFKEKILEWKCLIENQSCLYFPVHRFEKNFSANVRCDIEKPSLGRLLSDSRRSIFCSSPIVENEPWLFNLFFEVFSPYGMASTTILHPQNGKPVQVFVPQKTEQEMIYSFLNDIIDKVLGSGKKARLAIGSRKERVIAIVKDEELSVPDWVNLSTGEIQLINIFISILKDYDLSKGRFSQREDVKGIVIIDEIDAHLHVDAQNRILPELIKMFPSVQFVVATHSPFFITGMKNVFSEEGFSIFNIPSGEIIPEKDFSELEKAYDAFKNTQMHKKEMERGNRSRPFSFEEKKSEELFL